VIDAARLRRLNDAPVRADGAWVLYWMTAQRRTRHNPALERAVERAAALGRPLLVLEALRIDHPYASERLHRFAIEGMRDNAAAFAPTSARYLPWVEEAPGAGRGLLEALAARAAVVVTDLSPAYFLPRMAAAAAARLPVRVEGVDGCGLLPLAATERVFSAAVHFRRFLQGALPDHLARLPTAEPLAALPPLPFPEALLAPVRARWGEAEPDALLAAGGLSGLPLDRTVGALPGRGGSEAARAALERFLATGLRGYAAGRNTPLGAHASGLSAALHWGHLSPHEVLAAWADAVGWSPDRTAWRPTGARRGWWGADEDSEAFLDQFVTWRELSLNAAELLPGYDGWAALPAWARETLEAHAADPRPALYGREALEAGETSDAVWNAAQGELRAEGRIHGYLRMLWGKRLLEWTAHPAEAMEIALHLNDRWALDGRDPNGVSGVAWCLGRYDRPWAPERPIFGRVRYMSSAATLRKLPMRPYLEAYGAGGQSGLALGA
jgi:deoxyribodipyrimidine photo-lyase